MELPAVLADGRKAKYLVILTTKEAMQGTTKLPAPDQSAAEIGRADMIARIHMDQPIAHTAIGVFRLAFDYLPSSQSSAQDMLEESAVGNNQQKAEMLLDEKSITAASSVVSTAIQPETEEMFMQLIDLAIKNGESNKALRFVEEAELAGSSKARDAFFDAMKKYQK
ncbi:MAG: maltose operon protein [Moritella dasanensis]